MRGQPGSAGGPHAEAGAIDGSGSPPEIGVMMANPATGTVHGLGSVLSRSGYLANQLEQRFGAFGEVRFFHEPIIHLSIDVDGVLAAPGRTDRVVPEPLKVCRLRPWPR